MWRIGKKVHINVYDGDRPVCQCHTVEDAKLIVEAVNTINQFGKGGPVPESAPYIESIETIIEKSSL